jgi:hypothetical protein
LTLFDPDLTAAPGGGAGVGSTVAGSSSSALDPLPAVEVVAPETRRRGDGLPAVTTRLRLTVSYDGAGFRGFAVQPGQRTVAGVLADAIGVVVGHRVDLVCAGRTDAGGHAQG